MGMMDAAALAEICRRAEAICQKYDSTLRCEVSEAEHLGKYAALRGTDAPKENEIGIFVTADPRRVSQLDLRALVGQLEELKGVWRVFLTFPAANMPS
jgi:hypothetical protein